MSDANKAFLSAAAIGDVDGIQAALMRGADLNIRDALGHGALYYAVRNAHSNVFGLLRRFQIDVGNDFPRFAPGERAVNITLFVFATVSPTCSKSALSLLSHGAVNGMDIHRRTPLFFAVAYHRVSTVRALLEHGADVNVRDDTGISPLMHAARLGFVDIMQELLRTDVDLEVQGPDGTLLHSAAERKHFSMIRYLLERGARYMQADHDAVARAFHDFPLAFAAIRGDVDEIHDLLAQEMNSSKIIRALMFAIAQGQENAVAAFISVLINRGTCALLYQHNAELHSDPLHYTIAFLARNNRAPELRGAHERIYTQLLSVIGSLLP